jgi:MFS family permease
MDGKQVTGYKAVLSNSNCRKLIISNLINRFGDSIDAIAFTWLVYQITGSATWSAIIFGLNQLPGIIILPLAGAWVEGRNKKRIIIITDIIRGLVISGFVLLYFKGLVNPYIMAGFTLIITTVESFNEPAAGAFIPELVQGELFVSTQSLKMTLTQVVNLIGMAIAGVIISNIGIEVAMLIDVSTFFIGGIIIAFIRYNKATMHDASINAQSYFEKLINGFKYIKKNNIIIYYSLMCVLMNAVLAPLNSLLTPLVSDVYGQTANFLSACLAMQWIGSILASLMIPKVSEKYTFAKIAGVLGAIEGIGCYFLAQGEMVKSNVIVSYVLAGTSMLIIGFTMSLLAGVLSVELVKSVDSDYMARVGASFNAVATASLPAATFIVSALTVMFKVDTILAVDGIIGILIFGGMSFVNIVQKKREQKAYAA